MGPAIIIATSLTSTSMPRTDLITLDTRESIWDRVFLVSPLVVIGTREGEGFDLAPKHMATPLGLGNFFGFVCTAAHGTYRNACENRAFTVSFPRPEQIAMAGLSAAPRQKGGGEEKPILRSLPTIPATTVDGVLLKDAYLMLECELHQLVDDLGENSLLIGRVVAAYASEDALRVSDGDDQARIYESPLLAYVHPGRYAVVQETQTFPFPADFRH